MKIHLIVASVIAILAAVPSAALAIGSSRLDRQSITEIPRQQPGQPGRIDIHDNDSWNNGYYPPWSYGNQPFQFPNSGWYGNGYYGSPYWGSPYWGNSYGNNYYYNKPKRLTERQVVYAVKNQHFHQISKVWFDDGVYKVRAVDYYGRRVQLLVDPYNGRVLRWSFRR
jgi:hypothetical protein